MLCIEEEIFNTLESRLGLRLISFTLVPGKVTEQFVLETISKQTKGAKVSACICAEQIMLSIFITFCEVTSLVDFV